MSGISQSTYRSFYSYAEKTLSGDWVIVGGALLHLLGRSDRTTTDIDLVPLETRGNAQLAQSFELAEKLKLPVETINSAALYFLKKIPNFEKELVLLKEWKSGRIFRPSLFLFFQLKTDRLSETDALDCENILQLDLDEKTPETLNRILTLLKEKKRTHRKNAESLPEQLLERLIAAIQKAQKPLTAL